MASPFLQIPEADWIASNTDAFAIFDRFPVTAGHALVVTKRVVPTWFETTVEEQLALMELVKVVKLILDERMNPKPDGYNVGFNSGDAAGQTVPHVHIHVIPRYLGDVADPRGGIRHVIPDKGNYLKEITDSTGIIAKSAPLTLSTGFPKSPLWEHLSWRIAGARYRITTVERGTIVDAAHINPFRSSKNDDVRNGLALCKNAHWAFDVGLWSLDDECCVLVAADMFDEDSPDQTPLKQMVGRQLRLPRNPNYWPLPSNLAAHRKLHRLG